MNQQVLDLGGTERTVTPDVTLRRLQPLLPKLGITRVARVTGLDHIGVPVTVAIRPASRSLSVSQGKGPTPILADLSAIMESLESFHAEFGPASTIFGSYEELTRDHHVLDVTTIRAEALLSRDLRRTVLGWQTATDLLSGKKVLVPDAIVNIATDESDPSSLVLRRSSNGLASGNTFAEAACHALYELIERDSQVFAKKRSDAEESATDVDVDSVDGPCAGLIESLRRADLKVRLFDLTSPIGFPTFGCHIHGRAELRGLTVCGGYGTHHNRSIAACRSITEAVQSRLTIISASRDDIFPHKYRRYRLGTDMFSPPDLGTRRKWNECAHLPTLASMEENMMRIARTLETHGHPQVLIFDLTRPDIGVPVVYAIVPGLAHDFH